MDLTYNKLRKSKNENISYFSKNFHFEIEQTAEMKVVQLKGKLVMNQALTKL